MHPVNPVAQAKKVANRPRGPTSTKSASKVFHGWPDIEGLDFRCPKVRSLCSGREEAKKFESKFSLITHSSIREREKHS
uniref:Uncharacterized protein n=1 Tax=Steinernema glaseri TaxID=37863 RepID=A0A1I7ZNQ1_9BILA